MSEPFETAPDPVPTRPVRDSWAAPVPPAAPSDDAATQPVSYAPTADRDLRGPRRRRRRAGAPAHPRALVRSREHRGGASGWTRPAPAQFPPVKETRRRQVPRPRGRCLAHLRDARLGRDVRPAPRVRVDRPARRHAGCCVQGQTVTASQPAVDEQSAITIAAATVSPAIVTDHRVGSVRQPQRPVRPGPTTGIGSGVIFDSNGGSSQTSTSSRAAPS